MASCCSSYTASAYIWAVLSIISAITCPFGLYFSNWLEREYSDGRITSLSSYRKCENETERITVSCDDYYSFEEMYSSWWKAVTLLFGAGACLLILVALTATFGFCIKHLFNIVVAVITIIAQILGVVCYLAGVVIFPVGWDVEAVKSVCGPEAGVYSLGDCEIGWAFIIILVGTAVAITAAIMSWTPLLKRKKYDDEHSYAL